MSGAVAPTKKTGGVDKFTLNDERPFDSYIAKYEAEKQQKNKTALQAELCGQGAASSAQAKKPARKKSRVSKLINIYPHNVDHVSALCLDSRSNQRTASPVQCWWKPSSSANAASHRKQFVPSKVVLY
jgi:hypothetical protein